MIKQNIVSPRRITTAANWSALGAALVSSTTPSLSGVENERIVLGNDTYSSSQADKTSIKDEGDLTVSLPYSHWDDDLERKFVLLAEKEALDTASEQDIEELNRLQNTRRKILVPKTYEDLLFERERREAFDELQNSINKTLSFFR